MTLPDSGGHAFSDIYLTQGMNDLANDPGIYSSPKLPTTDTEEVLDISNGATYFGRHTSKARACMWFTPGSPDREPFSDDVDYDSLVDDIMRPIENLSTLNLFIKEPVDTAGFAYAVNRTRNSVKKFSGIIKKNKASVKQMQNELALSRAQVVACHKREDTMQACAIEQGEFLKRFSKISDNFSLQCKKVVNDSLVKAATIKQSVDDARYAALFGESSQRGEAICPITQSRFQPNEAVLQFVSTCKCNCVIKFVEGFSFLEMESEGIPLQCLQCRAPASGLVATTAGKAEDLFAWRQLQLLTGASTDDQLVEKRNRDMDKEVLHRNVVANAPLRLILDNLRVVADQQSSGPAVPVP